MVVGWLEERGQGLRRPWALAVAARSRALLAATDGDFPGAFESMAEASRSTNVCRCPSSTDGPWSSWVRSADGTSRRSGRGALEEAIELFERLPARARGSRRREAEIDRIGGASAGRGVDGGRASAWRGSPSPVAPIARSRHVVHERANRRGPSLAHLRQARHPIAHGARGVLRSRGRRAASVSDGRQRRGVHAAGITAEGAGSVRSRRSASP